MSVNRKEYLRNYGLKNRKRINDRLKLWRASRIMETRKDCADFRKRKLQREPNWEKDKFRRCRLRLRKEIVEAYGGKCACCGEKHEEFLTIDHINGNGSQERRELRTQNIYPKLKKEGFPKENYRLLCMNCNFSLGKRGYCPHKKEEL